MIKTREKDFIALVKILAAVYSHILRPLTDQADKPPPPPHPSIPPPHTPYGRFLSIRLARCQKILNILETYSNSAASRRCHRRGCARGAKLSNPE